MKTPTIPDNPLVAIPPSVAEGKYIQMDQSIWIVMSIEPQENERFQWLKVFVSWSGIGYRPLWADEPRTFLVSRRRKDAEG